MRNRRIGVLFLWLVFGAIVGSLLGEFLGLILPEGTVRQVFFAGVNIGFSPVTIDLAVINFTFGLRLTINALGVIGILFAGYYFRWFR